MPTVRALTRGPKHHFFGYYGISPWDRSMRRHLALETEFHDRPTRPGDTAAVGPVEVETGTFRPFARTAAFNFQQGSMLHWIDAGRSEEFTFNDWEGRCLVSRAVDPATGAVRTLGGAIAAVSPAAPVAMGLDYARMVRLRRVVGYATPETDAPLEPRPADDGLWRIDLATGRRRLVLSIAACAQAHPGKVPDGPAWLNHVVFSPDGRRLFFLCRAAKPGPPATGVRPFHDSLWTVGPDGSDLVCEVPFGGAISHFDWLGPGRILISSDVLGRGMQFVAFTPGRADFTPVGEGVLPPDGHASASPDGRWLVLDTYPVGPRPASRLLLDDLSEGRLVEVGRFASPEPFRGVIRCDLHPRWRPDGRAVSFDSIHEGSRQVYVAEVDDVVDGCVTPPSIVTQP